MQKTILWNKRLHLVSLSWCKSAERPHKAAAVSPPDRDPAHLVDLQEKGSSLRTFTQVIQNSVFLLTLHLQRRCWWRWVGRTLPRLDAGHSCLSRTQRLGWWTRSEALRTTRLQWEQERNIPRGREWGGVCEGSNIYAVQCCGWESIFTCCKQTAVTHLLWRNPPYYSWNPLEM